MNYCVILRILYLKYLFIRKENRT